MKAQVLLAGAVLSPGRRTVTAALRVMGLSDDRAFARYHHVLNRARWSSLMVSRTLLLVLIKYLAPGDGPLIFGIDETLERRRGKRISAKGIYRDSVRSSASHFVKASGLRWISLMWLAHVPWAQRTWALPVLTVLAPSERYHEEFGKTHKALTDWARQIVLRLRRWLPHRDLVLVADSSYAVRDLLRFCQRLSEPVVFVTRLRLDAALHEPAPPRRVGQVGRPRIVGSRLPTLKQLLDQPDVLWTKVTIDWYDSKSKVVELNSDTAVWYNRGSVPVPIRWVLVRDPDGKLDPQALLCTDLDIDPAQIVQWFVLRWQLEVTFQEVRTHLGVETQRQWSDLAIVRTTPALFGLFSWVTLAAHLLFAENGLPSTRATAWYAKQHPTFADAIAEVRRHLWQASQGFVTSAPQADIYQIPKLLFERMTDSLCYAA